jgi:hypothetical protein
MKILKGKWVNDNEESLSTLEIQNVIFLGKKVVSLFGEDITYERINIVNSLCKNNKDKERVINHLLENEKLFDKII